MARDAKAAIKRLVKRVSMVPGGLLRASGVRILTYHSVGYREHDMNVTPEVFREQMEWLAAHYTVVPLDAAADAAEGVALTFDDGFQDNLLNAAPVLRRLNLAATFFVVSGRAGMVLREGDDPATSRLMNWEEVRALEAMGFDIGAHTLTHPRLSQLDEDGQRQEILEGARLLTERLGHDVALFAYPFGSAADYNELSARLAREAGFRFAVSNRYGVNGPARDRWALRRTQRVIGLFQAIRFGG